MTKQAIASARVHDRRQIQSQLMIQKTNAATGEGQLHFKKPPSVWKELEEESEIEKLPKINGNAAATGGRHMKKDH